MPAFRIVATYPALPEILPTQHSDVLDLEDAWYEWRPDGLGAEICVEEYRLPAFGLAYVELVRTGLLPVAESLRDRAQTQARTRQLASELPVEGEVYELMLSEHIRGIPLLLFHLNDDQVSIYTRTFLEEEPIRLGILPGRDLPSPVTTQRTRIIGEIRRFLAQSSSYYISVFPHIATSESFHEWQTRIAALDTI